MNSKPLTYSLVLALVGVAFKLLPNDETTPLSYSPIIKTRSQRPPNFTKFSQKNQITDTAQKFDLERQIRDRLDHPDPNNRMAALQEIYKLNDKDIIRLLQELLLREKNGTIHQEVAAMLEDIAEEEAVLLVTTAIGDPDISIRKQAIEALGSMGLHGYSLLGQILLGDPEPALRLQALQLLATDGGPAAIALLQAVVDDDDLEISDAAIAALRSQPSINDLGTINEVNYSLYSVSDNGLVDPNNPIHDLSLSSSLDERIEAIRNLYLIDEVDALLTLKAILEQDENISVRKEALIALGNIGNAAAIPVISAALGDDSPELRHQVIKAIRMFESSYKIPLLGQVVYGDPDPILRLEAVRLLGAESGSAAHALLLASCEDKDERVSQYANELLYQ